VEQSLVLPYRQGNGVAKDEKKGIHYTELAAMQGKIVSRYNPGVTEYNAGKYGKALKHWLISCGRGHAISLEAVKHLFIEGLVTKEDYEKGLRSFQEYIDEVKSDLRDEAAAFHEDYSYIPTQNS
jgi:TPR repeat protein